MNPSIAHSWDQVVGWLERNPGAQTLPGHVQRHVDAIERYHKAQGKQQQDLFGFDYSDAEHVRELVSDELHERARRREAEGQLADYIEDVALLTGRDDLMKLPPRLRECRQSGSVGLLPDGGHVIYWDYKCGLTRLCPDESREETQRLTDFYHPEMMDFLKQSPTHRIFYAVLTTHNYRPGDLVRGKREQFDQVKAFIKTFPGIQGALVIQEDPLSAHADWNVHLNVFFLVRGAFDYKQVREQWGANVHIQHIKGDEAAIRAALREAIKYSAQIVPEKSEEKANDGVRAYSVDGMDSGLDPDTHAPAMTQWPAVRWCEWWDAQQGFRRTRAYGVLYAAHGKRWNREARLWRRQVCVDAELPDNEIDVITRQAWKEIGRDLDKKEREKLKAKLRHAMVYGEKIDYTGVRWVGTVKFAQGGGYSVDLIPGHNFSSDSRRNDNFFCTGPPG